jgi:hypothetical protein
VLVLLDVEVRGAAVPERDSVVGIGDRAVVAELLALGLTWWLLESMGLQSIPIDAEKPGGGAGRPDMLA